MQRRFFINTSMLAASGTILAPIKTWGKTDTDESGINHTILLITGHLNKEHLLPLILPFLKESNSRIGVNIYPDLILDKTEICRNAAISELINTTDEPGWCTSNFGQLLNDKNTSFKGELDYIKHIIKENALKNQSFNWINGFDTECVHYNTKAFSGRLQKIAVELRNIIEFVFLENKLANNTRLLIVPEHGLNGEMNELNSFDHHLQEARNSFGIEITKEITGRINYNNNTFTYSSWMNEIMSKSNNSRHA